MEEKKPIKDLFYSLATKYYIDIDYPDRLPIPILATFYFVLSKYFKEIKIQFGAEEKDVRFSFFWIEDSRSGKGQLIKLLEKVLDEIHISHARQTKFNSASLIGTIDENALIHNKNRRLLPDNEKYISPYIYGDLAKFDVLIFPEAKKLLMDTAHKEELLEDLQEAMDYPGLIRKKLKWDEILEYETKCSFYSTTYYAKEVGEHLLYKGFYQRQLLYMRELTVDETIRLRKKIIEMFSGDNNKDTKENFEKELKEFVNRLQTIDNSPRVMSLTPDAIEYLCTLMDRYKGKLDESVGSELTILKSFSQTVIDISIKIGALNALISGKKDKITSVDLTQSIKFVRAVLDTVMNKLVMKDTQKSFGSLVENKIISIYKDFNRTVKDISRKMLIDECCVRGLAIGKNKLAKIINNLVNQQYFVEIKGEKNTKYLLLKV